MASELADMPKGVVCFALPEGDVPVPAEAFVQDTAQKRDLVDLLAEWPGGLRPRLGEPRVPALVVGEDVPTADVHFAGVVAALAAVLDVGVGDELPLAVGGAHADGDRCLERVCSVGVHQVHVVS